MEVEFYQLTPEGAKKVWSTVFSRHHYMSSSFIAQKAFLGVLDGQPVVFTSAIFTPSGTRRGDGSKVYPQGGFYAEHRTVVLPDYQGMGLGVRASEWLGELVLAEGFRFYSKTAHPVIGAYREASPKWRAGAHNQKIRRAEWTSGASGRPGLVSRRPRYSHEYVGDRA